MADTNVPSINLIDLVKAHAYCYGEELRRCQCGQVTLNDAEWQAHFAHVLSLYVDVPAAPQSDHPAQGHIHSDVCYGKVPETEGTGEYLRCGKTTGDGASLLERIIHDVVAAWVPHLKFDTKMLEERLADRLTSIAAPTSRPVAPESDRESDLLLASATDLLNTWAREMSVQQAERPEEIRGVIDRLWSTLSTRLHHPATLILPILPASAGFDLAHRRRSQ